MGKLFSALRMIVVLLLGLSMIAGCGTGGLTETPAGAGGGTGTGTGTGTAQGSITFSLTKLSDGSSTTSVSIDSPATLMATAKDSAGLPIAGKVMSFSTTGDLSFNPASGTALTNINGTASIIVLAGNTTGATTIKADVTDAAGNAISGDIGLSVTPPNLSLSSLTITPGSISAGGSAAVSITIEINDGSHTPYTAPVPITFTSYGAQQTPAKATITSQVYTVNGVAVATYQDINYGAVDTITATLSIGGTTFTKTGTITVAAPTAASISFVSAEPANMTLKNTGGSPTSTVSFKVYDSGGNPINGVTVDFSLNTTVGGLALTTNSASSGMDGIVQTIVQAGTVPTPVRVYATIRKINPTDPTISTVSDKLVVSTGIPDQDSFSISASTLNIEGWDYDGVTSDISVFLADRFNNPVPDGTYVSFWTSGGEVGSSCTTMNGTCTVQFRSQEPRPRTTQKGPKPLRNGRAVVLAYALGEESFSDANGNGIYNAGELFTDMPEPFLDYDESGDRNQNEPFVDTNGDGLYSAADGVFNGILRDASINGPTTIHVRGSLTIVLSGSTAVIDVNGGSSIPLAHCTTGVLFNNTPVTFGVVVVDENGNVMPTGTKIDFSTTNGTILTTTSYIVPNTSIWTTPTYYVTIKSDATQDDTLKCTDSTKPPGYYFKVVVETPKGVKTESYTVVTD